MAWNTLDTGAFPRWVHVFEEGLYDSTDDMGLLLPRWPPNIIMISLSASQTEAAPPLAWLAGKGSSWAQVLLPGRKTHSWLVTLAKVPSRVPPATSICSLALSHTAVCSTSPP